MLNSPRARTVHTRTGALLAEQIPDGPPTMPSGPSVGPAKRERVVTNWVRARQADPAAGAFGGAPYVATKRVRCVPNR
eukprot:4051716-Pyramimonas_sp.AAC.1